MSILKQHLNGNFQLIGTSRPPTSIISSVFSLKGINESSTTNSLNYTNSMPLPTLPDLTKSVNVTEMIKYCNNNFYYGNDIYRSEQQFISRYYNGGY